MPVVMESHVIAVIGINSGKCNNRAAKVTADVLDNGVRISEIRFCKNSKLYSGNKQFGNRKLVDLVLQYMT